MFDVIVIGAGPAGSATAIHLARIGMQVRLYEKTHFPRPKLCGGFLSPECLTDLDALGVLESLRAEGALPVRRIVLSSSRGTAVEAPLPATGLSISRQRLDRLLLQCARSEGVDVQEGVDGFAHLDEAPWTVVAAGRTSVYRVTGETEKRSNYIESLHRFSVSPTHRLSQVYYGLQAYFEQVEGIEDQVELDLVPGGYVGLVKQERDQVNLCALTHRQGFEQTGSSMNALLASWVQQNPVLRKHLQMARQVTGWKAIGPVQMGVRQLTAPDQLFVGDAACVVDPFAGEGIAMGLQSARLIQKAFLQTQQPIHQVYEQMWRERFGSALRIDSWLRQLLRHRPLQNIFVSGLKTFPSLLTWLTENTRPNYYENLQPNSDRSAV